MATKRTETFQKSSPAQQEGKDSTYLFNLHRNQRILLACLQEIADLLFLKLKADPALRSLSTHQAISAFIQVSKAIEQLSAHYAGTQEALTKEGATINGMPLGSRLEKVMDSLGLLDQDSDENDNHTQAKNLTSQNLN